MAKLIALALLLAGIIGWAVRDEAKNAPAPQAAGAQLRPQEAQRVRDNAAERRRLKESYPQVWNDLARQTTRDLATCVVTEPLPGMLKADCR
jgi:hypothetical protein